jgi:hypothetical protein
MRSLSTSVIPFFHITYHIHIFWGLGLGHLVEEGIIPIIEPVECNAWQNTSTLSQETTLSPVSFISLYLMHMQMCIYTQIVSV